MLDSLRGAAKSWVAKVLIGLLVLSFGVFWGIQDVFRGYQLGCTGDCRRPGDFRPGILASVPGRAAGLFAADRPVDHP